MKEKDFLYRQDFLHKAQSHPELYILLFLGVKPQVLKKCGYSESTIYKYNRQLPVIKKRLSHLLMN